jgi:hypothetical protein
MKNIFVLLVFLIVIGSVDAKDYICTKNVIEEGNIDKGVSSRRGSGKVKISIDTKLLGNSAYVNYDGRYFINGQLRTGDKLYISDDSGGGYPTVTNRLMIDRITGEGFFQSSRYSNATSRPDFITERLISCTLASYQL